MLFLPVKQQQSPLTPAPIVHKKDAASLSTKIKLESVEAVTQKTEVKQSSAQKASSGDSIESIVRHAARSQGINEEHFLRIAKCESTLRPDAVNPLSVIVGGVNYGNAKGLFQFIDSTWKRMSAKSGHAGASVFDAKANAAVAAWAFANGHAGEWECR